MEPIQQPRGSLVIDTLLNDARIGGISHVRLLPYGSDSSNDAQSLSRYTGADTYVTYQKGKHGRRVVYAGTVEAFFHQLEERLLRMGQEVPQEVTDGLDYLWEHPEGEPTILRPNPDWVPPDYSMFQPHGV